MTQITHSDVGAWLLKGNPTRSWDYWAKRQAEKTAVGVRGKASWSLGHTYRNGLIEAGDKVLLFMTGDTQALVEIGVRDDKPLFDDEWDERYVIDENERGKRKPMMSYDGVTLPTPIARATIAAVPDLAQAEFLRAPQMTNPTYLTSAEVKALSSLIDPKLLALAGW